MTEQRRTANAQFTLFPMTDQFVDIILDSIKEVDTTNVEMNTDDVNTEISGAIEDVFDVTNAIFLHAVKTGEHVAISGTFAIGCPGTKAGTLEVNTGELAGNKRHSSEIKQQAAAKFSLYPLGEQDYMKKIEAQIDLSSESGVKVQAAQGATRLDGDVNDIFNVLESSFGRVQQVVDHTAMAFTVSANSPSAKK